MDVLENVKPLGNGTETGTGASGGARLVFTTARDLEGELAARALSRGSLLPH